MGYANNIGKYRLTRTIGEGSFAKVKLAINTENGKSVAMKIIDKGMVIKNNLIYQVQREIRTMKLLNHPNIVKIYEVIGTKTKIYIAMEYVSGGQLSNKMAYTNPMGENEARKHFQQLIDAVDYCHSRGVYHRDLKKETSNRRRAVVAHFSPAFLEIQIKKPENLLLDNKGNLKVSDFGLSALRKPGDLLSTACGSPSYVAPELLHNKGYDGAAADIWSCGVILFELLAGYLPFTDQNLMNLYKKIMRAEYSFPECFTDSQKELISRILEIVPSKRITAAEIIENQWFQTAYEPAKRIECEEDLELDHKNVAFGADNEHGSENIRPGAMNFINAFQLIAMSPDLDLSRLFEEQDNEKQKMTLGSKLTKSETLKKIEAVAKDVSLSVERMNSVKLKIRSKAKINRPRSCINLAAEVIEVAPSHCVIEVSNSAGELGLYREFCKSLSNMLIEGSDVSSETEAPQEANLSSKSIYIIESFGHPDNKSKQEIRGYSSS